MLKCFFKLDFVLPRGLTCSCKGGRKVEDKEAEGVTMGCKS